MKVENTFEVAATRDAVWSLLMDVPSVVPCVPGATLTDAADDRWQADLAITLGPVAMTFDAAITRETADESAGLVRLLVRAREKKGRGAATAEIESQLRQDGPTTTVTVSTSLRLQGAVARVARNEIVEEVSQQMTDSFAQCLKATLTQEEHQPPPGPPPTLRITFRTLFTALWKRLRSRR